MTWRPIRKRPQAGVSFNLADYEQAVREFSWQTARADLDGLPGGRGLNICHEAVDRHAIGPRAAATALRCIARDGTVTELLDDDGVGRIAFLAEADDLPHVHPLNYTVRGHELAMRTREGSLLDAAVGRLSDGYPAGFEVDHIDDAQREGWSVLLRASSGLPTPTKNRSPPSRGRVARGPVRSASRRGSSPAGASSSTERLKVGVGP